MKHVVLVAVVLMTHAIAGCKAKRSRLPSDPRGQRSLAGQTFTVAQIPSPKVATSALRLTETQIYRTSVGNQTEGIAVRASKPPLSEFIEYMVCRTDDDWCTDIQIFVRGEGLMADLPDGPYKVKIRACVDPFNAVNPKNNCGPWTEEVVLQSDDNSKLASILTEYRNTVGQLRQQCMAMHARMREDLRRNQLGDQEKALIANLANYFTPEVCASFAESRDAARAEAVAEEQFETGRSRRELAGEVLIGLGSVAGIAALAGAGYASYRFFTVEKPPETFTEYFQAQDPINNLQNKIDSLQETLDSLNDDYVAQGGRIKSKRQMVESLIEARTADDADKIERARNAVRYLYVNDEINVLRKLQTDGAASNAITDLRNAEQERSNARQLGGESALKRVQELDDKIVVNRMQFDANVRLDEARFLIGVASEALGDLRSNRADIALEKAELVFGDESLRKLSGPSQNQALQNFLEGQERDGQQAIAKLQELYGKIEAMGTTPDPRKIDREVADIVGVVPENPYFTERTRYKKDRTHWRKWSVVGAVVGAVGAVVVAGGVYMDRKAESQAADGGLGLTSQGMRQLAERYGADFEAILSTGEKARTAFDTALAKM